MTAGNGTFEYDLRLNQGEDLVEEFLWAVDGVPVDLTGATAKLQFRRTVSSAALLEISSAAGSILLGGNTGNVSLKFLLSTMPALAGTGFWDLFVTFPSGAPWRLAKGKFNIDQRVTQ
jgi:hypothetical protein